MEVLDPSPVIQFTHIAACSTTRTGLAFFAGLDHSNLETPNSQNQIPISSWGHDGISDMAYLDFEAICDLTEVPIEASGFSAYTLLSE